MTSAPALTLRRAAERGHANHGWLDARHTFSFAGYFDPRHVQFGTLRVLNQDRVAPGRGFPTHGHDNMEIVTYVLEGELRHKDSMGNGSTILPGDVQLMSAGTGVQHSEYNGSQEDELHLLQMWVLPGTQGREPRYEQRHFDVASRRGVLRLVVDPEGREGALTIGADARMYAGLFDGEESASLELEAGRGVWLHLAQGQLRVGDLELSAGDGVAVQGPGRLALSHGQGAEVVLWELPLE